MKKIIILLAILPFCVFAQKPINLQNNKAQIDTAGNIHIPSGKSFIAGGDTINSAKLGAKADTSVVPFLGTENVYTKTNTFTTVKLNTATSSTSDSVLVRDGKTVKYRLINGIIDSSNVAFLNQQNTFTQKQTVTNGLIGDSIRSTSGVKATNFIVGADTLSKYKLAHRYYVGTKGHFTTLPLAITWLKTHMEGNTELLLDGATFSITDSIGIGLSYNLIIRGQSSINTILAAATGLTGKPMFNVRSNVFFKDLKFDGSTLTNYGTAANENCINFTKAGVYSEITDFEINKFYKGINLASNSDIFVFNGIISNITTDGILANSSGANIIDVEVTNFETVRCGVNLKTGALSEFDVLNCFFLNVASDTALKYNGTTYTYYDNPQFVGNKWNGIGTFTSGFDFTLSRDANIYVMNNIGQENKSPHFKVNVLNSTDTTKYTTANTWKKIKFTATSSYSCKYTIGTNRYTYLPSNKRDVWLMISGNVSCDQSNRIINMAIVKNGVSTTRYAEMTTRLSNAQQYFPFTPIFVYLEDLSAGDYIEIWATSSSNSDILTFSDIQIMSFPQ